VTFSDLVALIAGAEAEPNTARVQRPQNADP